MFSFRIVSARWSKVVSAPGFAGRWNSHGKFAIYSAESRALACLENVVHRSGDGLNHLFRVMVIEIPDRLQWEEIFESDLPAGWFKSDCYAMCQQLGDEWLLNQKSGVLKVPSAIIKKEHNFLINPNHKDFNNIKLVSTEQFDFDPRLDEK